MYDFSAPTILIQIIKYLTMKSSLCEYSHELLFLCKESLRDFFERLVHNLTKNGSRCENGGCRKTD